VMEGAAELSIRPQSLLLAPGAAVVGALPGRITKAAYLGSHMEYWVVAEGLTRELFVIAPEVVTPFVPGADVAITLAPSGVAVVPQG
jgi:iron(III) transport system ATP-binding protein